MIYDIAIIGGGITGITTASLYKKESPDSKIIILEKNIFLGGLANTEKSGDYFFDSVYLFPDINIFLKYLSIRYKPYKYNDFIFRFINAEEGNQWAVDIPYDTVKLKEYLSGQFPEESKNIAQFITKSMNLNKQFSNLKTKFNLIDIFKLFFQLNLLLFNLNKNLKEYLDSFNFKNKNLVKVLSALSGLANLPPEELNALISIVGFSSLQKGAYRQNCTFNELINEYINKLKKSDVQIKMDNQVKTIKKEEKNFKIILENNTIYYSRKVISTINTFNIFHNILSKDMVSKRFLNKIDSLVFSHSAFIMRFIIKNNTVKYPVDIGQLLFYCGENTFTGLYNLANADQCILDPDKFHFALSVRNQEQKNYFSMELLSIPVSYNYWKNIYDLGKLEYKNEINIWENFFIDKLKKYFDKDIEKKIILKKIYTPVDLDKTFNLYKGSIYDMSYIRSQSGLNRLMFKTPIKNFYHLKMVHGIYGSIFQSFLLVDYLLKGKINNYKYKFY